MKKTLLLIVVIAMIIAVAGAFELISCKPSAATEAAADVEKTTNKTLKTIGVSHYLAAWEFTVKVQQGIDEVTKANGITTSVQDCNYDAAKQLTQIETFINSGVDAIFTNTVDGESLNPSVLKAVEKGIGVVSMCVPCQDATVNYLVDEYKYGLNIGTLAGQWAQKNFPGEKIEAVILTVQDYKPGIERRHGMKEAFAKEFPTGVIVSEQNSVDVESAMKATEVILQAYPNARIFMADSDDTGAIGAYEALKAKVNPADYPKYGVFGADGMEQAIKDIKENGMYRATVDVHAVQMGKDCINLLLDWASGKAIEKTTYCEGTPVDYEIAMKQY